MRSRRSAFALAGALVAGLLTSHSSPANADSTIVVRNSDFGSESNGVTIAHCNDPYDIVTTPAITVPVTESPLGTRALRIVTTTGDSAGGWATTASSLAGVTTFSIDVRSTQPLSGVVRVYVRSEVPSETNHLWIGSASVTLSGSESYQTVSGLGLTMDWVKYLNGEMVTTDANETITSFLAAHGGDRAAQLSITVGCGGADVTTDRWRIGDSSGITTYDLEGNTSSVTVKASKAKVVHKGPVTLSTTLKVSGDPAASQSVSLQAKQPNGSFSTVGSATTNAQGVATLVVKPTRATTYRWSYAGTTSTDGSVSGSVTVTVIPKLTAKAAKARIGRGDTLVVTGKVSPTLAGTKVTLWRKTGIGPVNLATATINAQGRYRATKQINQTGTFRVFTTIPAVGTFPKATSPTVTVTVTRQ